ncbi:MAG: tetratricopeptide repeat protein, partial [Candidatus Omnitrophica bacterium]|nr:tetratricopeptide repeat protein [Candidatus Omnitrophota bacterium]
MQDLLKKPYMDRNQESEILKTERPKTTRSATRAENVVFLVKSQVKKHLEKGKALFDEGDPRGAKEAYEKALEADPTCAIAYFYLGFTHHEMGNTDLAKDYYFQAIDLEPKQSLFLEHLARLHFELGEYSVCLVRFQEAHSVGMLQPISYGLMGRAFFELDRYTEATDCLEKMLEIEEEPSLRRIAYYYAILAYLSESSIFPARLLTERLLREDEGDPVVFSVLSDRFQDHRCLSVAKRLLESVTKEDHDFEERHATLDRELLEAEHVLPQLFCSEEESLLHQLHQLSQFGSDKVHRVLVSLIQSPSQLVREGILSYCRKFGFDLPKGVLKECLNDTEMVREATLLYVASTYDRAYMDLLLANINNPSREVRSAVARYLERRGGPIHLPILEGQMEIAEGAGMRRQLQRAIIQPFAGRRIHFCAHALSAI